MISVESIHSKIIPSIKIQKTAGKFVPYAILLLIFAYYVVTRAYNLKDKFGFDHDQEEAAKAAWDLIYNHKLSLIGIETSTGGLFVGPLLNWTHTIFLYAWNFDPIALAYQAIVFSALAMIVLFKFVKELTNTNQALIATGIYSISARLFSYDISGSPLSYMSLVTITVIYLTYETVYKKKRWLLPLLMFTLALGYHVHLTLLLLMPISIIVITRHNIKPGLKVILVSMVSFLIPFITAFAFEARHDFLMTKNLSSILFANVHADLSPARDTIRTYLAFISESVLLFNKMSLPIVLLIITVVMRMGVKIKRATLTDLAIFTLGPFVILLFYSEHIPEYYFLSSIPAFIVFMSFIYNKLYETNKKVFAALFIPVLVFNTITIKNNSLNPFSLKVKKDVVNFIQTDSKGKSVEVIYSIPLAHNHGFAYLLKWQGVPLSPQASKKYVIEYKDNFKDEVTTTRASTFGYFKVFSIE